eukprot:11197895-Lingulodinium_polyedra.AAC.1
MDLCEQARISRGEPQVLQLCCAVLSGLRDPVHDILHAQQGNAGIHAPLVGDHNPDAWPWAGHEDVVQHK